MSIASFERNASVLEMAVEMDRRGAVIESLEALITELQAKVARMEVEAFDAAIAHGKTKLALAKSEASREAAEARLAEAKKVIERIDAGDIDVSHTAIIVADAPALLTGDAPMSFADLDAGVGRLAAWLRAAGARPGDRVASWSAKTRAACLMPLAAARAGLIHVPVNPLLKAPQVAHILADSGAALLLTNRARADMLGERADRRHFGVAGWCGLGRGRRLRHWRFSEIARQRDARGV